MRFPFRKRITIKPTEGTVLIHGPTDNKVYRVYQTQNGTLLVSIFRGEYAPLLPGGRIKWEPAYTWTPLDPTTEDLYNKEPS